MKKFALNIFALGVIAAAFTSCNDAKYDAIENRVYIAEAAAKPLSEIVMGDEGSVMTAPVTVRLAQATDHTVTVKLHISQANLDAYNKLNQTTYEMVPEQYVSIPTEAVINPGEVSTTVPVQITAFKGEGGVEYALSMALYDATGMEITETSSKFIYALAAPLKQYVPGFQWNNGCRLQPDNTDWDLSLTNYTLEWWSNVNGYSINNQAIFANGGSPELYIRFGDLIYSSGGRYMNNFLQVKTFGGQFDSGNPTTGNGLEPGTWYHFALTYDAATGVSLLYKNGAQIAQLATAAGQPMIINHLNMFDSGSQYFRDIVQMAQVRLWNVTRTPDQIATFMRKEVKFNDPNLIFYLPMSEIVEIDGKNAFMDVTGHGHNMIIGEGGENSSNNDVASWTEVDFSSI